MSSYVPYLTNPKFSETHSPKLSIIYYFITDDSGGPKSGKLQCIFRYEYMNIDDNVVTYRIGGRSLRVVIWI